MGLFLFFSWSLAFGLSFFNTRPFLFYLRTMTLLVFFILFGCLWGTYFFKIFLIFFRCYLFFLSSFLIITIFLLTFLFKFLFLLKISTIFLKFVDVFNYFFGIRFFFWTILFSLINYLSFLINSLLGNDNKYSVTSSKSSLIDIMIFSESCSSVVKISLSIVVTFGCCGGCLGRFFPRISLNNGQWQSITGAWASSFWEVGYVPEPIQVAWINPLLKLCWIRILHWMLS